MWTDERTEGRADRRTDMTKLIVAFRNFANAHKNEICKIEIAFNKSACRMRVIILPSRLHIFRAYSWRAHSMLGIMLKYNLKKMVLRLSLIVAQLREQR